MDWQVTAPTLIELIMFAFICFLLVVVGVLASKIKRLSVEQEQQKLSLLGEVERVEGMAKNANNQHAESQARTLVITRHLQTLDENQTEIQSQIRELKLQDPSLRLYQRAAELVKQGATIDEIMDACDIPRAEAEMLMMVHRNQS